MENDESQDTDDVWVQLLGPDEIRPMRKRGVRQSKEEKNRKAAEIRKFRYHNDEKYYAKIRSKLNKHYKEKVSGTTKERERCRKKHYKAKYGISHNEYLGLSHLQNGLCSICGNDNNGRNLCVDHCHETGKIRSLLCTSCNAGIGNFKEDVTRLISAIEYIKKYKQVREQDAEK